MALAGAAVATLIAIATYDNPPAGPPLAGLVARPEHALRAIGPFGNPNYLGTFAAAAVATGAGLLAVVNSGRARGLVITVVLVAAVALLLSQSRGALVAAFVGLSALALTKSRVLALAIIGLGLLAAVVVYPAFVEWRLENLGVQRAADITGSDEARLEGVLAGPQLFLSSPIFGIGFGHYTAMSVQVPGIHTPINSHNWYVNVLAEQGLVGVFLWLLFAFTLVRAILRRPMNARLVAMPVLATLATASLFLEAPTSYPTVALPALVLVATLRADWGVSRRDHARLDADAPDVLSPAAGS
jgi:O-antigen ligase